MVSPETHIDVIRELEPVVAGELDRHLKQSTDWKPHEYVPWGEGRNFSLLGGDSWSPEQSTLGKVAQTAMFVNLLTEDNLPSYHREIATRYGRGGAWGQWVGRWTAEEARHGIALRDYLVVTRAIDPDRLEAARMSHMAAGYDSGDKTALETIAYVTLQELATRVAHRNTGSEAKKDGDVLAEKLLARIAKDENLHMVLYRNLARAALDISPNEMMRAITTEVSRFAMPGAASIPDFRRHSVILAKAGIYDQSLYLKEVLKPTLTFWEIFEREDLSGDGAAARDELQITLDALTKSVSIFNDRRAAAWDKAARGQL